MWDEIWLCEANNYQIWKLCSYNIFPCRTTIICAKAGEPQFLGGQWGFFAVHSEGLGAHDYFLDERQPRAQRGRTHSDYIWEQHCSAAHHRLTEQTWWQILLPGTESGWEPDLLCCVDSQRLVEIFKNCNLEMNRLYFASLQWCF